MRKKRLCYVSSVDLGEFKQQRFQPHQYHPRGWDWYGCFEQFFRAGLVLRYKVGKYAWIVSNNKRCINAFMIRFPNAIRKDF